MTSKFLLLGGRQNKNAISGNDWNFYTEAVIAEYDLKTRSLSEKFTYKTPKKFCPENSRSSVFKAGCIDNGYLYVCTLTEVLKLDIKNYGIIDSVSIKEFNDNHHVFPFEDTIIVTSTGLDIVIQLTWEGKIINVWNTSDTPTWEKFDIEVDYRLVDSTKPHDAHPNYAFVLENEIWATRCHYKDAICLTNTEQNPLAVSLNNPTNELSYIHDGLLHNGLVYFTTVNGYIIGVNPRSRMPEVEYNLNKFEEKNIRLGWTRGLCFDGPDSVIVGFSRVRRSKLYEGARRLRDEFLNLSKKGSKPTHIAKYNLSKELKEWEVNIEDIGINAVFSILPLN